MGLLVFYLVIIFCNICFVVTGINPELNLIILYFLTIYKLINLPLVIIYAYMVGAVFSEVSLIYIGSVTIFWVITRYFRLRLVIAAPDSILLYFIILGGIYSGIRYLATCLYYHRIFDFEAVYLQGMVIVFLFPIVYFLLLKRLWNLLNKPALTP